MPTESEKKKYWLDKPTNVNKLVYFLYGVCALLFLFDFFYARYGHYEFENWYGFYAIFGFISYVALIHVGKALRKLVKRNESYYDD